EVRRRDDELRPPGRSIGKGTDARLAFPRAGRRRRLQKALPRKEGPEDRHGRHSERQQLCRGRRSQKPRGDLEPATGAEAVALPLDCVRPACSTRGLIGQRVCGCLVGRQAMRTATNTQPIIQESRPRTDTVIAAGIASVGLIALVSLRSRIPAWSEMWL